MIPDKSNSLYIDSKIKKQAHQYAHLACLHSDKPFQTKKPQLVDKADNYTLKICMQYIAKFNNSD
jgi:hypothetical protein